MKLKNILIFLLFQIAYRVSYAQIKLTKCTYAVNNRLSAQINNYKLVDSGQLENSMTIEVPWGDNALFDQTLDCYTKSYISNDTIFITGHMIGLLGYGFQLILFKDSCIIAPFAISNGKIYKYNLSDPVFIDFIPLPTKTQKVVLTKSPAYIPGEAIEGFVNLESQIFYYKELEGTFEIKLKAYFKTSSIKRR